MSAPTRADVGRPMQLLNGYQRTCVLVAAVQIGLVERLREGPVEDDVLARDLGAHGPSLRRLVRALTVLGIVERVSGKVALSGQGRLFARKDMAMRDLAVLVGEEYLLAWADLRHTVMTGEPAFARTFGMTAWDHRKQHPHLNDAFNHVTSGDQVRTLGTLASSYDFSEITCVVDVGGGLGDLLVGLLKRIPRLTGVLFDQPHVVEGAAGTLSRAGMQDRCRVAGGSFLESVPSGGDAYLMKHVLHNWDDEDCVVILRNSAAAMSESSVLLVLENVLPEDLTEEAAPVVMLDVHMMTVLGGRERTQAEYAALFAAAGLKLVRCILTPGGVPDIIEAKRAAGG